MVFFVLSGFLIGKSVINNVARNEGFNLTQYATDRILRLYPPLVIAIIIMSILVCAAPLFFSSGSNEYLKIEGFKFARESFTTDITQIIGSLAFLNGFHTITPTANGPLWSLPMEFWYYVIAAGIFLIPSNRSTGLALLLISLAATYRNQQFYILMPVWFSGFAIAFIHHKHTKMNIKLFTILFFLLGLATIASIWLVLNNKPSGGGAWHDRMNHFRLISGLWFACYLALIAGGKARFTAIFHKTASFSYTLYIIHFPIMLFILGFTQSAITTSTTKALATAAISAAITIPIAIFLSKFSENKALIKSALPQTQKTQQKSS